ncbi:hypothetical protein WJX81_002797 [Elliptochloris bilobata]|uniref:tRNA (guanine(9)-N(1))-methyltransferase n=1 Tax=Elliptochloris bilobata TaxID=381761 RepID=A0AAW1R3S4_9CHLO
MKKRAKLEAKQAKRAERKECEKKERAALAAARKEEAAKRVAAMTTEEALAFRAECRKKREDRQAENKERKARLAAAVQSGQRIIIDLDFADFMTDQELRSLAQQLSFSYAANARAAVPAHLHLTSVAGRMGEVLHRQLSGMKNWLVTRAEEPYLDQFAGRSDELVYLTADSPNELEALDPGKAYIIGGIVDRNRHKDLCAGKARKQGIATARLPVSQHFKLTSSAVLTVNQVVEALLNFADLGDWRAALERTIPALPASNNGGAAEASGANAPAAANGVRAVAEPPEDEPAPKKSRIDAATVAVD